MSTQAGFGDILAEIGRGQGELKQLAEHILTTSPDVTVSTNLGPWVNRRGIFDRHTRNDVFRDAKLASAQRWGMSPKGQHIELGIAEQNLFLLLGAAGLTPAMTGARLLPIGTVYDPFVNRGLDALIYACYQDARFLLVSTPSGLTLAPEGGQHQSINTPLIGMAADRLASFEPAHVDELAILLRHAFDHMQRPDGSSVWLRLSTRQLEQPERALDASAVIAGAHWVVPPADGARIAIAYQGPVAPEADAAFADLAAEEPGAGLLAITSPDRLHAGWLAAHARTACRRSHGDVAYGTDAGAHGAGRRAGHRAGRPSCDACLAGCGARPACDAAGTRPFRPERRHPRPVSRIRHRPRRHPGRLRTSAFDPIAQEAMMMMRFHSGIAAMLIIIATASGARADDVTDQINEALKAYQNHDTQAAVAALDGAANLLRQARAEGLKKLLPPVPPGWTADTAEATAVGSAMLGGGTTASRTYHNGPQQVEVQIMANSPMLQGMAVLLGSPFAAAGGLKTVVVDGRRLSYSDNDNSYMRLVADKVIVKIEGNKDTPDPSLKSFVGAIDFAQIEKLVQ